MSITTIFDFIDPTNYTLSNIVFSDGVASLSLVPNPSQTFSQPFSSGVGFTYNSSKTNISAGVLSQINLSPPNSTFFAGYNNSTIDANWGSGSVVSTNNGASLGANQLDLLGGVSTKYVDYSAVGNAQSPQTGCVRVIYIPNYSGTPSTFQLMFRACEGIGSENNLLAFFHNIDGSLAIRLFDASGASIISADFGVFNPTAGTRYEIELNLDITTGATRLFVDGLQSGSTFNETGTRSSNISLIRIGEDATLIGSGAYANFSITDIVVFSTVQHTSSYSAPSAVPSNTLYSGDTIVFPAFSYSGLGALIGFSGFSSGGDVGSPRYILNGHYWNGSMWISSNGTYAQSNDQSTVSANIGTFPNNNTLTIRVVTLAGNVFMSITGPIVVTYSGQIYPSAGGTILTNPGLNVENIISFSDSNTQSGSDKVTFALQVNGVLKYWNGTAWVVSNGTFSQTNSSAVTSANAGSLLTVNSVVKIYVLLISGDGSTTPSIDSMTLVYNFGAPSPSSPATTLVYGFLSDITASPVVGAQIIFSLVNIIPNAYMEGADHILISSSVIAVTDSNGYFEQPIIATTQFEGVNTFIQVVIKKGSVTESVGADGNPLYIKIPIQANIDITTLLSA